MIQLRRISPTDGDWITLRTSRSGQHYYAHVDNATLPAGRYQFRETVPDQAGNSASGDRNRSGDSEVLYIDPTHVGAYQTGDDPAHANGGFEEGTTPTKVTVGIVRGKLATCKPARAKKTRRRSEEVSCLPPCPKAKQAKKPQRGKKVKCKPAPAVAAGRD